jgi:hypothetical protein
MTQQQHMHEMEEWLNIVSQILWGLGSICQMRCGSFWKRGIIFVTILSVLDLATKFTAYH